MSSETQKNDINQRVQDWLDRKTPCLILEEGLKVECVSMAQ
ncbi:hypothetical protein [Gemmata sp. SH-PL17]|nr:hypothetical protein [Gemmata sp. SH-PL17]